MTISVLCILLFDNLLISCRLKDWNLLREFPSIKYLFVMYSNDYSNVLFHFDFIIIDH